MEQVLGVAIGIAAVCLLLSIIASHVQEVIAAFTSRRAATLEVAIEKMLQDPALLTIFVNHPLIQSISFNRSKFLNLKFLAKDKPRPTYIASPLFSKVLLTALSHRYNSTAKDFPAMLHALPESALKNQLTTLMAGIEDDAAACNAVVEQWYDSTMDRVNGYYKRHTQWILMVIGLGLAILCNANLFRVTSTLWLSKDARDATSVLAQKYACSPGTDCKILDYQQARHDLEESLDPLPLGYNARDVRAYWQGFTGIPDGSAAKPPFWDQVGSGLYTVSGWILTAIAVSLGAPFWFDMLNNFINLRIAGAKPPTAADSRAETSKSVVEVKHS